MRRGGSGYKGLFAVLLPVLVLLFLADLALGSVAIPLMEVGTFLFGGAPSQEVWGDILLSFRLPKALTALFVGMGLALSGLQMQTLFRNPLAGPFVLGISAGASLGVALLVLGTGFLTSMIGWAVPFDGKIGSVLAASIGAMAVLFLILVLARRFMDHVTLLIAGLMLGYLTNAVVNMLMYFSEAKAIQAYVIWTFGSFSEVSVAQLWVLGGAVLAGSLIPALLSKWMNALLLGETYARGLGVSVNRFRYLLILSTGLMAGAITAFCGPIAFIGVAIPHLARGLFNTSDHRVLVPGVLLSGAIVALACDIVAQLPGRDTTLPINSVTSIIGAPIVLWVVIRMRNLRSAFG